MKEIKNYGESIETILLLGNKNDREAERAIKQHDALAFSQKNSIAYIETSALNANNVDKAFEIILGDLVKNKTKEVEAAAPAKLTGPVKKISNEDTKPVEDQSRNICSCNIL